MKQMYLVILSVMWCFVPLDFMGTCKAQYDIYIMMKIVNSVLAATVSDFEINAFFNSGYLYGTKTQTCSLYKYTIALFIRVDSKMVESILAGFALKNSDLLK